MCIRDSITILLVAFVWWVWPIIKNALHPRKIPYAISWAAVRACLPGAAGYFALRTAKTHSQRYNLYYNGTLSLEDKEDKIGWFPLISNFALDLGSLMPAILLIKKRADCDFQKNGLAPSFWYYPTVPTALIGLWITLDATVLKLKNYRWSFFFLYLSVIGVALGIFIPSLMGSHTPVNKAGLPVLAYIAMTNPWAIQGSSKFQTLGWCVIGAVYAVAARTGGVAYSAFTTSKVTRSNELPLDLGGNKGFGAFYLGFGIVCSLFAIWGLRMEGGPTDHVQLVKEQEWAEWRDRTETTVESGVKEPLNVAFMEVSTYYEH